MGEFHEIQLELVLYFTIDFGQDFVIFFDDFILITNDAWSFKSKNICTNSHC